MLQTLKRLFLGVGSFIAYVSLMWEVGVKLGVGTSYDLAIFSWVAGMIGVYLLSTLIVTKGTDYKFVIRAEHPLTVINAILGHIVLFGILGAAALLSGKVIYEEGFSEYLSMMWLPPLMMCFIPTLLMSWKAKEGDQMCKELAAVLFVLGYRLERTKQPLETH